MPELFCSYYNKHILLLQFQPKQSWDTWKDAFETKHIEHVFVCVINFPFYTCQVSENRNFQLWDTRDKAENVSNKGKVTFIPGSSLSFSPKKLKLSCFSVPCWAKDYVYKGKEGTGQERHRELGTCNMSGGAPWHQREAWEIFMRYGQLLSSRDREHSQSKGPVALGLLRLLSWFSHLLAAGSAWEGSAP